MQASEIKQGSKLPNSVPHSLDNGIDEDDAKDDHLDLPRNFALTFAALQVFFIIAFFLWTEYDSNTDPSLGPKDGTGTADLWNYSMFQDVHGTD